VAAQGGGTSSARTSKGAVDTRSAVAKALKRRAAEVVLGAAPAPPPSPPPPQNRKTVAGRCNSENSKNRHLKKQEGKVRHEGKGKGKDDDNNDDNDEDDDEEQEECYDGATNDTGREGDNDGGSSDDLGSLDDIVRRQIDGLHLVRYLPGEVYGACLATHFLTYSLPPLSSRPRISLLRAHT